MLLEIALGDAYGAGFEFVSAETIAQEHHLTQYRDNQEANLLAGQYTDDTQMTIAIMELMLSGQAWTKESIAQAFLEAFHRDPRKGYAKRFYSFLIQQKTAAQFLANIRPHSTRNGAAMRAVPIGLYPTLSEVKEKAALQASVTHDTPQGIVSAQAVACLAHYFIYQLGPAAEIKSFLAQQLNWTFDDNKIDQVACDGLQTVEAVLTVLRKGKSLREVLDLSIQLGGDTDSVASIALGLASFSTEYANDLPLFLYADLEQGVYGKAYLEDLDARVLGMFL